MKNKIVLSFIFVIALLILCGCSNEEEKLNKLQEQQNEYNNNINESKEKINCYDIIIEKTDTNGNVRKSSIPRECWYLLD